METLTFSQKVITLLIMAMATCGIALYYQWIQRPGHILSWWRVLWGTFFPQIHRDAYAELRTWPVLFVDAWRATLDTNANIFGKIIWVLICLILISVIVPIALCIGTFIFWLLKKLGKPIAICIHCNIFWLCLAAQAVVFRDMYGFLALLGTTYLILTFVLALPTLRDKFD